MNRTLAVATSNRSRLVVEVTLEDGRLSITGEQTDTRGGYSGGQIGEYVINGAHEIAQEPGGVQLVSDADLESLAAIWRRWHLNDMRPNCEHQTGPEWDREKMIEFRSYSVDWDDRRTLERQTEKDAAALGVKSGQPAEPYQIPLRTPTQREEFRRYSHAAALLFLLKGAGVEPFAWHAVSPAGLAALSREFEIVPEHQLAEYRKAVEEQRRGLSWKWAGKHRASFQEPKPPVLVRVEKKGANWLRPEEHPEGFLCKPCAVCGYKYGTKWLREEIPAEVVAELERLTADRPAPPSRSAGLEALGFEFSYELRDTRPGARDWMAGTRHYRCKLKRGGRVFEFWFSQGPGIKDAPELADVIESLRLDAHVAADEDEAHDLGVKPGEWLKMREQSEKFLALVPEDDARAALGLAS